MSINSCNLSLWLDSPTKRTVLRRKELKLQPPAFMLLSDLGQAFSLACMQYIIPSPNMIYIRRLKKKGDKDVATPVFYWLIQKDKTKKEKCCSCQICLKCDCDLWREREYGEARCYWTVITPNQSDRWGLFQCCWWISSLCVCAYRSSPWHGWWCERECWAFIYQHMHRFYGWEQEIEFVLREFEKVRICLFAYLLKTRACLSVYCGDVNARTHRGSVNFCGLYVFV